MRYENQLDQYCNKTLPALQKSSSLPPQRQHGSNPTAPASYTLGLKGKKVLIISF